MTEFQLQDTVGEIVTRRPHLSRVFELAGVDYCCRGKKTLEEACQKKSLDPQEFLKTLEKAASKPAAEPDVDFASMPLTELADLIERTHHAYLREEVSRLDFVTRNGVDRIRVRLQTKVEKAVSQNVIADLPGAGSNELTIVSAHHDSVLNNPGADDNCSGVAVMLEIARHFSRNPPHSGLRFISFGTEEQLSEGARHYLLHEPDLSRIRFALNNDAMGGWMGRTEIYCTGSEKLKDFVEKVCRETGFPGHPTIELSPFSDHFPLNLAGIPSAWYYRKTFAAARHFHHSRKETEEVVSPAVLARTTLHQVALLES